MARVPRYTQDRLASSLVGTPNLDLSGYNLAKTIEGDSLQLAQSFNQLAVKKQKEIDAANAKLQNVNDTLTAYEKSTALETQMWEMIDKNKKEWINDPKSGLEMIQREGSAMIQQGLAEFDNNPSVKEKMAGILTNSLRGKLNEVNSWRIAQDTANAKVKIQNTFNQLYTQASGTSDFNRVQSMINAFVDDGTREMDFNNLINFTYGAKGPEEIENVKRGIAEAYILGMLDRKECNQAKAMIESGKLDAYMDPETKHKYLKMADSVIKAEEKQERMDNMFEIFDIKQNAAILANQGKYSISQSIADNKRIVALGGKPTTSLTTQGVRSEKIQTQQAYKANRSKALEDITNTLGGMTKKGKLDPELELKDIVEFQNKIEAYRPYLTDSEYKTYMTKVNEPKVKRIKKMGKNIFGMPYGEMSGRDTYSRSYLAIYNFAEKAYAGKDNRYNAINNMITDFVRYADQLENRQGKEMTQQQAANLCNKVIMDQRRRSNPALNNIPETGQIMQDKNGRRVKVYPDGRYEPLN